MLFWKAPLVILFADGCKPLEVHHVQIIMTLLPLKVHEQPHAIPDPQYNIKEHRQRDITRNEIVKDQHSNEIERPAYSLYLERSSAVRSAGAMLWL